MIPTNSEQFDFKLACDGYDLIDKFDGNLIGRFGKNYARKHCKIESLGNVDQFIEQCVKERQKKRLSPRDLPENLCDEYEVGYFVTSPVNCFSSEYILFNFEQLSFWERAKTNLWDLEFMVVPSRGWDGVVNELGFRILNPDKIKHAFKWLFPFGQRATFGLNRCVKGKQLLLCEGFQDMVAFRESDYDNVVGLGSAEVTDLHKQELQTEDYLFCQDMDGFGMLVREGQERMCFYRPEGKDPYEVWQKHGYIELVRVVEE